LSRDLADAVLHDLRGFCGREVTAIGREICLRIDLRSIGPQAGQLRDLLFERHARQEIGNSSIDWKARILVVRACAILRIHVRHG